MFRVFTFKTSADQMTGLQYRPSIEPDLLFVFPYIQEGMLFHSRNVAEPFDLAYLNRNMEVIRAVQLTPPLETDLVPAGATMALEAKAGNLRKWGFLRGGRVSF